MRIRNVLVGVLGYSREVTASSVELILVNFDQEQGKHNVLVAN